MLEKITDGVCHKTGNACRQLFASSKGCPLVEDRFGYSFCERIRGADVSFQSFAYVRRLNRHACARSEDP